jgi:hypothetical protein
VGHGLVHALKGGKVALVQSSYDSGNAAHELGPSAQPNIRFLQLNSTPSFD